ncbi:tryptophan halogenase family protein [Gayadomonas joobiniege]|uniref:tryptophan halogenase family protein n=1 Tax=Gayadomonas joobiniege TaxID=1234606 RepID=UPI0003728BED|nr:tryptophan halogenase family protein [Gayadomonas joobiniege]
MKTKILIAGGGSAGWITAAVLSKGLPAQKYQIELIESQDVAPIGVGEASIPPIFQFLTYLEVSPAEFIKQTGGTFKYGIDFEGWGSPGRRYMHAFGPVGTHFEGITFADIWLAYAEQLGFKNLIPFSSSAVAAYKGKFSLPKARSGVGFKPLEQLFSAFHFDAGRLANFLKDYAIKKGCIWRQDHIASVNQHNQKIDSLTLASGQTVTADYFADCTGQVGLFNKQTLNGEFLDWRSWLPCDSALVVPTDRLEHLPPYTKSVAMSAGWRWQIPLQNRTGNGYVFSSQFITQKHAEKELQAALKLSDQNAQKMRLIQFKTGYLKKPWQANSIAIGLSAGFAEPLESTSIHLIYKYAIELKNAFIYGRDMQQEADDFNLKFEQDMLDIRDFLIAHYKINQYKNNDFWSSRQNMAIPDRLGQKLNSFKQSGQIDLPTGTLFSYYSWFQVLLGQGILDDQNQQVAALECQKLPDKQIADQFFKTIYQKIHQATEPLSAHQAVLRDLQLN